VNATDFDKELYQPAVNGTRSILTAIKEYNPAIKRVVVTSSCAAVVDFSQHLRPGYVYTEADWNPVNKQVVDETNNPRGAYQLSKKLAEQAAWDFIEQEKPNFSVTTLCPPMIYGPLLAEDLKSMDQLNTSSTDVYRFINGSQKDVPPTGLPSYVDVRDSKSLVNLPGQD
jgi:nucleoside-diphosphate-sugar epimerase